MRTDRLNMIIRHINAAVVADIGTDHAYIPVQLIQQGKAERVIATDVRRGPLEAAARSIRRAGIESAGVDDAATDVKKKIELRMGNGLAPIGVGECGNIIIAGMGGELITTILEERRAVAKAAPRLLLQPMNSQDMLRKYLAENGFRIEYEDIACEEFKVYNLIIASAGEGTVFRDEFELHLPEYLRRHENFPALVRKKQREFSKILSGLKAAQNRNEDEINRYKILLGRTEELL